MIMMTRHIKVVRNLLEYNEVEYNKKYDFSKYEYPSIRTVCLKYDYASFYRIIIFHYMMFDMVLHPIISPDRLLQLVVNRDYKRHYKTLDIIRLCFKMEDENIQNNILLYVL